MADSGSERVKECITVSLQLNTMKSARSARYGSQLRREDWLAFQQSVFSLFNFLNKQMRYLGEQLA